MTRGVLGRVGVVEVRNLFVPLRRAYTTEVRPSHERAIAPYFDLRLEGVGDVRPFLVRGSEPVVHEEDRHGSRARWEESCKILPGNGPVHDLQSQATGARDLMERRVAV